MEHIHKNIHSSEDDHRIVSAGDRRVFSSHNSGVFSFNDNRRLITIPGEPILKMKVFLGFNGLKMFFQVVLDYGLCNLIKWAYHCLLRNLFIGEIICI